MPNSCRVSPYMQNKYVLSDSDAYVYVWQVLQLDSNLSLYFLLDN